MVCEPFTQWVLEDHFGVAGPPFEEAGVQLVEDVEPYELMKLRLLNAGHQALCYFGYLAGYRYGTRSPRTRCSPGSCSPTWTGGDADPGAGARHRPRDVQATLIERFSNAQVRDTSPGCVPRARTGSRSGCCPSSAQPGQRGEIERSTAVVASWARYAEGSTSRASRSRWSTGSKDTLMAAAARQQQEPLSFIANREVFGDLIDNERLSP